MDHPPLLGVLNAIEAQVAAGDRSGLENLAHNALAEAYRTELVDEVAAGLGPMGIGFCGTAELFLNDPDLCVPNALRSQFDRLATRVQQELFKDFLRSTLARRDIFIRDVQRAPGAGQAYLEKRAQATLTLPRAAALEQVSKPGWTAFRYATPEIEFVFERLADGATRLHEIAEDSVHAPADLWDAFCKLVACPGIEPCLRAPVEAPVRTPLQIRPASPFNQLALQASRAGTASIHLASPVLGSCIELPHAEAMLLAGLCGFGTTSAGATVSSHAI